MTAIYMNITPDVLYSSREIIDVCQKQGRNYQKQRKTILEVGLYRVADGRYGWKDITRICDAISIGEHLEQHDVLNKTYANLEVWVGAEKHNLRFTTKELYDFHRKPAVMQRLEALGWKCSHRNLFVHYVREQTQDFHPRYRLQTVF